MTAVFEARKPVLVFGGPYGNLQATRAVLDEAEALGISPDHVICTGDLVAYCGEPEATIDFVFASGIRIVMGNCDEQLGNNAEDCGCGFPEGGHCERLSSAWFGYARRVVSARQRDLLAALPRRLDLKIAGRRLAVIHGGVRSINRFIFASHPTSLKGEEIALSGCDGVIAGHCGIPFSQIVDGRLWHNPGVVGMPANDGTPRVWFSVLTPNGASLEIEHRSLTYDHTAAAAAIRNAGLPTEYAEALDSGLWPNLDILPDGEKRAQGQPLRPGTFVWPDDEDRQARERVSSTRPALVWPTGGIAGASA